MIKKFRLAWIITFISILIAILAIATLDSQIEIPVHWNFKGEVDHTAHPAFALIIMPAVQILIIMVFNSLKYFEPRAENLARSEKAVRSIAAAVSGLLLGAQLLIVSEANGYHFMGPPVVIAGVGILTAIIGNYFSKLRSSFFLGIRTPWTLSSDYVWQKTHRFGGRVFMVGGLITMTLGFIFPTLTAFILMISVFLVMALATIFYSWAAWRSEQEVTE